MVENLKIDVRMESGLSQCLQVGGLVQSGIRVCKERDKDLGRAVSEAEGEMRRLYEGCTPAQIPGLRPARNLYRSLGVDPTRYRPASEALIRRILKGGDLPAINSAVDAANLLSLRHLIPVGLYDYDKIQPPVLLRLGQEGERYDRIGKGTMNLAGRIGLFDRQGGFGNPTGDSGRTAVGPETTRLLFIVFFPADHDPTDLIQMVEDGTTLFSRFLGGQSQVLGHAGLLGE